MAIKVPTTRGTSTGRWGLRVFCALVFVFLMAPILAIIPLSFNSEPFFTYPLPGLSLRWYREYFTSADWQLATRNSFTVAILSTILATALGTLAAVGLMRPDCPWRRTVAALIISPIVIPVVVAAVGIYYFYADLGLVGTLTGLVASHTALGAPFVVITVSATLAGFDDRLMRAAASLGATPATAFRRVMLPLIMPGVVTGAIFAFVASFDEVVVALFLAGSEQRTLPRQMWSGLREQISPTITAVATLLILFATVLMLTANALQKRDPGRKPAA
ncbi:ABC transporter permease [uncultured Methylobacterium sp.]|uniref:ABC transporter permease n=1 Tax=uncultured Methylobacterium sp. TaxID=157278 RepID=UPI00259AD87A|nr:ABC transporter permease [uncultured Methylobacterium sp.]